MSEKNTRWEVITQEDENGDIILPIPEELISQLGWKEGDEITFDFDINGKVIMRKA